MNHSLAEVDEQTTTESFLAQATDDQLLEYIQDMVSELETLSEERGFYSMAKIMSLAKYEAQRHKSAVR